MMGTWYNFKMRKCKDCNREFEEKSFYNKGNGKRGNLCHSCRYRKRNKEYKTRHNIKNGGYEINTIDYLLMLKKQNNLCAICNNVCSTGKSLAIDHDHTTGRIRGLLCFRCNAALGMLKDSPEIIRAALRYLED